MVGSELGQNFHFSSIAEAKKCLKTEFFESAVLLSFDRCRNNFVGVFFQIKNAAFLFFSSETLGSCEKFDTDGSLGNRKSNFFFLKKFFFLQNLKLLDSGKWRAPLSCHMCSLQFFIEIATPQRKWLKRFFSFFRFCPIKTRPRFKKLQKWSLKKLFSSERNSNPGLPKLGQPFSCLFRVKRLS